MITTTFLITIIILGLLITCNSYDYDVLGFILVVFSSIYLLVHLASLGLSSYEFDKFKIERDSFEQTLKVSRGFNNEMEQAAISKDIIYWNSRLALIQYDNKTLFFDQYIDDRFETLKPIK